MNSNIVRSITLIISLLILTLYYSSNLSFSLLPPPQGPQFVITFYYSSGDPEYITDLITAPLEKECYSLEGVKMIRSVSSQGKARIAIEFHSAVNEDEIYHKLRQLVFAYYASLPSGVSPPRIDNISMESRPIFSITFPAATEVSSIIQAYERIPGIGKIHKTGDNHDKIAIEMGPRPSIPLLGMIQHYQHSFFAFNFDNNIKIDNRVSDGNLDSLIFPLNKRPFSLSYNANITKKPVYTYIDRVDLKEQHLVTIYQAIGTNIIQLSQYLRNISEDFPEGLIILDRGQEIKQYLFELSFTVLTGIFSVIILLFIVFKQIKGAFIVAYAIPFSIFPGIIISILLEYDIHILTLAAISASVGSVIDSSVFIYSSHINKKHVQNFDGRKPLALSTVTSIIVFIPLIFMPSELSFSFLGPLIFFSSALICSLLYALYILPSMMSTVRNQEIIHKPAQINSNSVLQKLFILANKYKIITLLFLCSLLPAAYAAIISIPKGDFILPSGESISFRLEFPAGSTLKVMEESGYTLEKRLLSEKKVKRVAVRYAENQALFTIILHNKADRKAFLMKLEQYKYTIFNASLIIPAQQQGKETLTIHVHGRENKTLQNTAKQLAGLISYNINDVEILFHFKEAPPTIEVELDLLQCARYGIFPPEAGRHIFWNISESPFAKYGYQDDIIVKAPIIEQKKPLANLLPLQINNTLGDVLPISAITKINQTHTIGSIHRRNLSQHTSFIVVFQQGNRNQLMEKIETIIDTMPSSQTVFIEIAPEEYEKQRTFSYIIFSLICASVMVFLLAAFWFNSFKTAIFILIQIPLTLSLPIIILQFFDTILTITIGFGLIMASGITVNNSLILIHNTELESGEVSFSRSSLKNAIIQHGTALSISSFTTALGIIPLLVVNAGGFITAGNENILGGLSFIFACAAIWSLPVTILTLALFSSSTKKIH